VHLFTMTLSRLREWTIGLYGRFIGLWSLFSFLILYTVGRTP
jgi:hypothetical protein